MLKFTVNGQNLKRIDDNTLVQYAVKFPEAEFEFNEEWDNAEKTAQWQKDGVTYDTFIVDNKAVVPWEVLQEQGTLTLTVIGVSEQKVITTNTITNAVIGCGAVGAMVSAEPTETCYRQLVDEINQNTTDINRLNDTVIQLSDNMLKNNQDIRDNLQYCVATGEELDERITTETERATTKENELETDIATLRTNIENVSSPTDEQVSQAINDYLSENPVQVEETDKSLSIRNKSADAGSIGELLEPIYEYDEIINLLPENVIHRPETKSIYLTTIATAVPLEAGNTYMAVYGEADEGQKTTTFSLSGWIQIKLVYPTDDERYVIGIFKRASTEATSNCGQILGSIYPRITPLNIVIWQAETIRDDIEKYITQDYQAKVEMHIISSNRLDKIEKKTALIDDIMQIDCWGDSHTGGGSGSYYALYADVQKYDADGTLNESGEYVRYMNTDGTFTYELASGLRCNVNKTANTEGDYILMTANTSYPTILKHLIEQNNDTCVINNMGLGGQTIKNTLALEGVYPLVLEPCVIPPASVKAGYVYCNGDSTQKFKANILSPIAPLDKNGTVSTVSYNTSYVLGFAGTCTFTEQTDGTWLCNNIQRYGDDWNVEVEIKYPTVLIPFKNADEHIKIIMMGTNCGFHTIDDLINGLIAMVGNSEKYIIVSDTGTGNNLPLGNLTTLSDDYAEYDSKLVKAFGKHYLKAYEMQIKYGLMYNGLSDEVYAGDSYPTEIKGGRMDIGNVGVHYTQYGNNSLAYWIYCRGKELGYWK